MAVTHEGKIEYFEGLTSTEFNSSAVNEIYCIILGLDGAGPLSGEFVKGIADELSGLVIWLEDVSAEIVQECKEVIGLEVVVGSRPEPTLPMQTSKLVQLKWLNKDKNKKAEKLKVYHSFMCSSIHNWSGVFCMDTF